MSRVDSSSVSVASVSLLSGSANRIVWAFPGGVTRTAVEGSNVKLDIGGLV